MTPKVEIPEGYELLSGRGRDNAVKALALARERGLDESVVLTSTALGGFLIPIGDSVVEEADADETENEVPDAEVEEIEFPDAEKASHAEIDAFAADFPEDLGGAITYEGIEAANAEKPTKAEKVAHITKVVTERAEANTAALESGEPAGGIEPAGADVPKED